MKAIYGLWRSFTGGGNRAMTNGSEGDEFLDFHRSHVPGVLIMLAGSAATYVVTSLCLSDQQQRALTTPQRLDLACFEFLAWWWIAYFLLSHLKRDGEPGRASLFTLRGFLDGIGSHRNGLGNDAADSSEEQRLREKVSSSRDVQGIMIAVVVLLLTLIVVDQEAVGGLSEYQRMVRGPVFAVALVAILGWMLSMDIFDTILNPFQVDLAEASNLRSHFYRSIGPLGRKSLVRFSGAVSYGYLGHALMPIFVLMVFSWFEVDLVGFATALYVFLAYPYYFGYWAVKARRRPLEEAMLSDDVRWEGDTDLADATSHWTINLDGDRGVRLASGYVFRQSSPSDQPDDLGSEARRWPPRLLGMGFLLAGLAAAVI